MGFLLIGNHTGLLAQACRLPSEDFAA